MDDEPDFIDKQLEAIDLLLYKMRFYQEVYEKWVKINLGVIGMKLTDKERDNWDKYQKFLIDRGTKESITDAKELCDLISSERTAWEEIKRLKEENKQLTDKLQDALKTLYHVKNLYGCEMWGETLQTETDNLNAAIDRIQGQEGIQG